MRHFRGVSFRLSCISLLSLQALQSWGTVRGSGLLLWPLPKSSGLPEQLSAAVCRVTQHYLTLTALQSNVSAVNTAGLRAQFLLLPFLSQSHQPAQDRGVSCLLPPKGHGLLGWV